MVELLLRCSDAWWSWVITATLPVTLIAGSLVLIARVGRRWPSPLRYLLLVVALVKFAVPPFVSTPWSLQQQVAEWVAPSPIEAEAPTSSAYPAIAEQGYDAQGLAMPRPSQASVASVSTSTPDVHSSSTATSAPAAPTSTRDASASTTAEATIPPLAFALYLFGVLGFVAALIRQSHQLERRARRAIAVESDASTDPRCAPVAALYRQLADRMGVRNRPRLLLSDHELAPLAFGLIRPRILIPPAALELSEAELSPLLAHELAHHRRGDLWMNTLQIIVSVLWWYHPLVWWLGRELRRTREDRCDDFLLARGYTRDREYCRSLLRIAEVCSATQPIPLAAGLDDAGHPMDARFTRIFDRSIAKRSRCAWPATLAVVLVAATVLPGAQHLAASTATTPSTSDEPLHFAGRVLGPDDNPVAGATLRLGLHADPRTGLRRKLPELAPLGTTDERGRFTVEIDAALTSERWWRGAQIVATAPDHGPDWQLLRSLEDPGTITLRLVAPGRIRGRLLDLEGRPCAGVQVRSISLASLGEHSLEDFATTAATWQSGRRKLEKRQFAKFLHVGADEFAITATTDEHGEFELSGLGEPRLWRLEAEGEALESTSFSVLTADLEPFEVDDEVYGLPYPYYAREFEVLMAPSRTITGRVVDASTGSPLSGVDVEGSIYSDPQCTAWSIPRTTTDTNGRFQIDGLPHSSANHLVVRPPEGSCYLPENLLVPDEPGTGTIDFTIEIPPAIWVEGRITDTNGDAVEDVGVYYGPDNDNPEVERFLYASHWYPTDRTDADGRFRVAALPGPGRLGVSASQEFARQPGASFDELVAHTTLAYRGHFVAVALIDPRPDEVEPVHIELTRGEVFRGELVDPAGEPITGVTPYATTLVGGFSPAYEGSTFELFGFDLEQPRQVFFLHRERQLAATLDPANLERVVLQPTGSFTGRFVDSDGQPYANYEFEILFLVNNVSQYHQKLVHVADEAGRFHIDTVVPGVSYLFYPGQESHRLSITGDRFTVDAGSTRDLGDIRVRGGRE